jgi:hypothetical protein
MREHSLMINHMLQKSWASGYSMPSQTYADHSLKPKKLARAVCVSHLRARQPGLHKWLEF